MTTLATIEQPQDHVHGIDDLLPRKPEPEDAGVRARSAMAIRASAAAKAAKRILYKTIAIVLLLSLVSIGGGGYYIYATSTRGYVTDHRACELEVGGYMITGERTYSYPYVDFLMWRSIDKTSITEKTLIDVRGSAMTIVGIAGEDVSIINVGEGEKGTQLLKPADTYVFTVNKKVAAKSHKTLCK